MTDSTLHKPTPLEELAQQSLPSEAYETQPTYSRPVRYSPSTNQVTPSPLTGGPGGAMQETRTDIGEQAAQENLSNQLTPQSTQRDEIRPADNPVYGGMSPTSRETLLESQTPGTQTYPVSAPKDSPQIERRLSGQETISTQWVEEQQRIQESGQREYETPLRHSMIVSRAIVGDPESQTEPTGQMIASGVQFAITLPAQTLMAPVETPGAVLRTGKAIQEKGIVGVGQETYSYIAQKPYVRGTQAALTVALVVLPIGAKFVRGRATYSTQATGIETSMLIEKGEVSRGISSSKVRYSTGETGYIFTEATSTEIKPGIIQSDARSLGVVGKGKQATAITDTSTRSFYAEGDVRPFSQFSTRVIATEGKKGQAVFEPQVIERVGKEKTIIDPFFDVGKTASRTTGQTETTFARSGYGTKTTMIMESEATLYKKTIRGEVTETLDPSTLPESPSRISRTPSQPTKPTSPTKPGLGTEQVSKTSLGTYTEQSIQNQVNIASKPISSSKTSSRIRYSGSVAPSGPETSSKTFGFQEQASTYPGPSVYYPGKTKSGFDDVSSIATLSGTSTSSVRGVFRVQTAGSIQGTLPASGQMPSQISHPIQDTGSKLAQVSPQATAQVPRMSTLKGYRSDIPLTPDPVSALVPSSRGRTPRAAPIVPIPILGGGSSVPTRPTRSFSEARGFRYQPTLGGIVSGETIGSTPKGSFSGLEVRQPIRRKKRR